MLSRVCVWALSLSPLAWTHAPQAVRSAELQREQDLMVYSLEISNLDLSRSIYSLFEISSKGIHFAQFRTLRIRGWWSAITWFKV